MSAARTSATPSCPNPYLLYFPPNRLEFGLPYRLGTTLTLNGLTDYNFDSFRYGDTQFYEFVLYSLTRVNLSVLTQLLAHSCANNRRILVIYNDLSECYGDALRRQREHHRLVNDQTRPKRETG